MCLEIYITQFVHWIQNWFSQTDQVIEMYSFDDDFIQALTNVMQNRNVILLFLLI